MSKISKMTQSYGDAIRKKGLSIYDPIERGNSDLWIPTPELETLLNDGLVGISLAGLPLRTRSKVVKQRICQILGYPTPLAFKKTQPRFLGQDFDTYVQKSNNLQVWNEEIAPNRRYAIIRENDKDLIVKVKVVTGSNLTLLDKTGTLTQKHQARLVPGKNETELVTKVDTDLLRPFVRGDVNLGLPESPVNDPRAGQLLAISEIFKRLRSLVGMCFTDRGCDQERNRGADLQRIVCQTLGYDNYRDDGQFPDIRHQLLEIKLQTSPTIDLGLVCPNSIEAIGIPKIEGRQIRHCDTRYALFYAVINGTNVTITHLYLTTGEHFFDRFPQFQGKVLNKKLQIPLPGNFFNT